jgi:tRNA-(ms[2]io[6]A)-hydroxylase
VAALIEARSCERFKLLAQAASDERVGGLFGRLLASEAKHHGVYVELARALGSEQEVEERMAELATAEARILSEPAPFHRLHT